MGENRKLPVAWFALAGLAFSAQGAVTLPRALPRDVGAVASVVTACSGTGLWTFDRNDHAAYLEWARANIPEDATVLFFSDRGQGDAVRYYPASYVLYPRKVWLASPSPRSSPVDFHIETPLDADYRISRILIIGIPPELLPLPPASRLRWFDRGTLRYVVELPPS